MGVELLSPGFLAGLLAAGVPIAIHLLNRRQSRLLPIATLRFLRQIPARTIRRRRLEEILLLAARVLLLALLALAGARPVLRDAAAAGGSTAVAIVFDDSWSMEARKSGIPRVQEGVQAALAVVGGLSDGDRAALVPASRPEGAALGSDLPALARRIRSLQVSPLAPDLLAATRAALGLLRDAPEPNREIILVTDFQARALRPLIDGLADRAGDERIRLYFVDVGLESPADLAVVDVEAGNGAVVAGEKIPVAVKVANYGPAAANCRLSLSFGATRVAETEVALAAGESKVVTMTAAVDAPGTEEGHVRLSGDDLAPDDVRHFVLPVAGRIPVLLVNGDPSPLAFQDETFFLRAALSPEDLGGRVSAGPISLKTVTEAELARENLTDWRVLILANVASLSAREVTRVKSFVLGGGGLLLFVGNRVRTADYDRDLGTDPRAGLLPAVLGPPTQFGETPEDFLSVGEIDRNHPLFAGLPPRTVEDLGRVHFKRALAADSKAAGGTVIARLDRGGPLLVEKEVGAGRVLFVNTSADMAWGALPIQPVFLPLLHRAIRRLAGAGEESRGFLLGATVPIPIPVGPEAPPEVTAPSGEITRPTREDGASAGVRYGPLLEAGIYRVRGSGRGDFRFAANPDPAEGDLTRLSPGALRDRFGAGRVRVFPGGEILGTELARSRRGRPIWGYFLGAALLLLLFEGFFANRLARRRTAPAGEEVRS